MANEEHLEVLRQGVKVWNQWRRDNRELRPDLSQANFSQLNLRETDFSNVDLRRADFCGADLRDANLRNAYLFAANLRDAILIKADLRETTLTFANLTFANLIFANLSDAILFRTDLRNASLSYASLRNAYLSYADLRNASLSYADLRVATLRDAILSDTILIKADLRYADLSYVNLRNAILSDAILSSTNLSDANLSYANLIGASLFTARLINTNLDKANLTGAHVWEIQRAGWSIKGVICEYIYWNRYPNEKNEYAFGEFERLFAEQTKIRLSYKNGISLAEIATLPALIQHLADMQGCTLRFVSIHESSGGAVVELAIEDTAEKSSQDITAIKRAIEESAKQDIETLRQAMIGKEYEIKLLNGKVEGLKDAITHILKEHKGETIMGDKYEISGQAGAVGRNAHAHHNTFNQQVNHSDQSIDLVALASELAQLRLAIAAKQDSSTQAAIAIGEVAKAELAAIEKDTPKVIEHLKAAGKWTLDFARDIGKDVVAEAIRQAMG
jgi:uncharacterized protein YjbI with pentapeptide repeats